MTRSQRNAQVARANALIATELQVAQVQTEQHFCKKGPVCPMYRKVVPVPADEHGKKYYPPQYVYYVEGARGLRDEIMLSTEQEVGFNMATPKLKRWGNSKKKANDAIA